jgi:hypothetical protein
MEYDRNTLSLPKTPSGRFRGDFEQFLFVVRSGDVGDMFGAPTEGNSLEQGIMTSRKNFVLMAGKHGIMRNQRPLPLTRVHRKSRWTRTASCEHGYVTTEFMQLATENASPLYQAVENVLKGKEVSLPEGVSFADKDGHARTEVRIRWFEHPAGKTFKQYALPPVDEIPDVPVPESTLKRITPYDRSEPPVLFGHYWLRGDRPTRLATNVACVDYSVAKGGSLCAYRWDEEIELDDEKFVSVKVRR